MRNERLCLGIAFCFALLPALLLPSIIPTLRLSFFAPFLVLVLYRKPLLSTLWFGIASGLVLDLLGSYQRLGLHPLCYCLTIGTLSQFKSRLFIDKLTTLPIMTFLFGFISTPIQLLLLHLFDRGISPSWGWAATDLLIWPLADALYGFLWFAYPMMLLRRVI